MPRLYNASIRVAVILIFVLISCCSKPVIKTDTVVINEKKTPMKEYEVYGEIIKIVEGNKINISIPSPFPSSEGGGTDFLVENGRLVKIEYLQCYESGSYSEIYKIGDNVKVTTVTRHYSVPFNSGLPYDISEEVSEKLYSRSDFFDYLDNESSIKDEINESFIKDMYREYKSYTNRIRFLNRDLHRDLLVREIRLNGDDVIMIQKRLVELGFNPGSIDGWYGPLTEKAVKEFQIATGRRPNGIIKYDDKVLLYSHHIAEKGKWNK